jgi:hypothetical protein
VVKQLGSVVAAAMLSAMVLAGSVAAAGAEAPRDDQPPVTIGDKDGYPQISGKNQLGAACAPRSGAIGGGLILTLGGQNSAAGAGTGIVGCGTFYGLEVGGGPPKVEAPDVEPAIFFDPGQPSGRAASF